MQHFRRVLAGVDPAPFLAEVATLDNAFALDRPAGTAAVLARLPGRVRGTPTDRSSTARTSGPQAP